jgi:hypothetical protein
MSEQSAASNGLEDFAAPDLLDPYEKLVSIDVLGRTVDVPENNRLLRCFQYLSINTISYDRPALSCRLVCEDGMVITKLSRFIELEGITK